MLLDLKQEIQQSIDFRLLNLVLEALAGQKCLGARGSYADELQLHFGEQRQARHPKLAHLVRGSWVLTTRSSSWRSWLPGAGVLLAAGEWWDNEAETASTASHEDMISQVNRLKGVEVRLAELGWRSKTTSAPNLFLAFVDGSRFELIPNPENVADSAEGVAIADWELFTPYGTFLRVGPGLVWSLFRSDLPASVDTTKAAG